MATLQSIDKLVQEMEAGLHKPGRWLPEHPVIGKLQRGELVITQSHENAVTFEHHILTEGERRGDEAAEDHSHQYDLRDPLPAPVDARVQRWGGALPQYRPGHPDRVAAARAALAPHGTLALAGAGYDGVGIPICIRSGQTAADLVLKALGERRD